MAKIMFSLDVYNAWCGVYLSTGDLSIRPMDSIVEMPNIVNFIHHTLMLPTAVSKSGVHVPRDSPDMIPLIIFLNWHG